MFDEMPRLPGIYAIRHRICGKVYVGSAQSLHRRARDHFLQLRDGRHFNRHLQAAFARDGADAFEFVILELAPVAELLAVEQRHIDQCRAADQRFGYNSRPKAESNRGRKATPEQIERNRQARIGKKQSAEWVENRIAPLRGRSLTAEHRRNIGTANAGNKRPDVARWAPEKFASFGVEQVLAIRAERAAGMTYRALAEKYECSISTAHFAVNGTGNFYRAI